jgi:hypothetical protein
MTSLNEAVLNFCVRRSDQLVFWNSRGADADTNNGRNPELARNNAAKAQRAPNTSD